MDIKRGFASDNNSGVHPNVIQELANVNHGHVIGYGDDSYSAKTVETMKKHFGDDIEVFFVFNGTGANVLSLKSITHSFNAVICAETSHINVDECGAPENITGCKLLSVSVPNGKLTIEKIKYHIHGFGDEHHSQPKVISITQVSELGTVYTPAEIKEIADYAHENKMYLHMDGARLCNAAASLNCDLRDITTDVGVDVLSFGITKNGAMNGEAVVFFNKDLAEYVKFWRKHVGQLGSKMRFMSAQFEALLKDDLWRKNADHANKMAQKLYLAVKDIPEIKVTQKVEANGVFAVVPAQVIPELQDEYFFYMWDEHNNEVRWMTSFDTQEEDIDAFVKKLKELLAK